METAIPKKQSDNGTVFPKALHNIVIESLKAHPIMMNILTQAVQSNQDLREKLVFKILEAGLAEETRVATVLQQALDDTKAVLSETDKL